MKKYLLVIKNTWDEALAYRLNFVMWRIRVILQLLAIYFLWFSIIPKNASFAGYTQSTMLTYVLGTSFIESIVIASRSFSVGSEINNGNLSNYLLQPINYFLYWFARDIGDKMMNISFSVIELVILFLLLKPPFFFQTDPFYLVFTLIAIILAMILYFLFNFLIGTIGFWTPDVWAPRFIYSIVLTFFAGSLFPLDILPKTVFEIFRLLPFTYLLYFPLKIYLGQLPLWEIYQGLGICLAWTILVYLFTKYIWGIGLRSYTAQGR